MKIHFFLAATRQLVLVIITLHYWEALSQDATNWGPWQPWSLCSASCGGGKQFRWRLCNQRIDDSPQHERKYSSVDCHGKHDIRWKLCNIASCSVNSSSNIRRRDGEQYLGNLRDAHTSPTNSSIPQSGLADIGTPDEDDTFSRLFSNSSIGTAHSRKRRAIRLALGELMYSQWTPWTSCSCTTSTKTRLRFCIVNRHECRRARGRYQTAETVSCRPTGCYGSEQSTTVSPTTLETTTSVSDSAESMIDIWPHQYGVDSERVVAWSTWSEWSPCEILHGSGRKARWRECLDEDQQQAAGCLGDYLVVDACSIRHCSNRDGGGGDQDENGNQSNCDEEDEHPTATMPEDELSDDQRLMGFLDLAESLPDRGSTNDASTFSDGDGEELSNVLSHECRAYSYAGVRGDDEENDGHRNSTGHSTPDEGDRSDYRQLSECPAYQLESHDIAITEYDMVYNDDSTSSEEERTGGCPAYSSDTDNAEGHRRRNLRTHMNETDGRDYEQCPAFFGAPPSEDAREFGYISPPNRQVENPRSEETTTCPTYADNAEGHRRRNLRTHMNETDDRDYEQCPAFFGAPPSEDAREFGYISPPDRQVENPRSEETTTCSAYADNAEGHRRRNVRTYMNETDDRDYEQCPAFFGAPPSEDAREFGYISPPDRQVENPQSDETTTCSAYADNAEGHRRRNVRTHMNETDDRDYEQCPAFFGAPPSEDAREFGYISPPDRQVENPRSEETTTCSAYADNAEGHRRRNLRTHMNETDDRGYEQCPAFFGAPPSEDAREFGYISPPNRQVENPRSEETTTCSAYADNAEGHRRRNLRTLMNETDDRDYEQCPAFFGAPPSEDAREFGYISPPNRQFENPRSEETTSCSAYASSNSDSTPRRRLYSSEHQDMTDGRRYDQCPTYFGAAASPDAQELGIMLPDHRTQSSDGAESMQSLGNCAAFEHSSTNRRDLRTPQGNDLASDERQYEQCPEYKGAPSSPDAVEHGAIHSSAYHIENSRGRVGFESGVCSVYTQLNNGGRRRETPRREPVGNRDTRAMAGCPAYN
ncbi:uncharacterized protein [Diadema setosum]|uniref:uncharacterized protein n=1 Tax=Diadema setosum TaxID=31175 RepID=UPI003B3BD28F